MTIEEKLKHFLDVSVEGATRKSSMMIDDHTKALDQIFEQHKTDAVRKADLQLKRGMDSLAYDKNKELSKEQIRIKKETSHLQEELKEKVFMEVKELLEEYRSTKNYQKLLIKQIKKAKEFAGEEEIAIYIDPIDSECLQYLQSVTNIPLTVSEYSFMGGTKALIRSKNIVIDDSFETRFNELKEAFTFINK